MKKSDIKTLSDVQKYLNSIPYINCGGCGYSAYAIYLWLKKTNYPKINNVSFVYLYSGISDDYYYKTNESFIKGERSSATACSHIMVNIGRKNGTKFIDSSPEGIDLKVSKYHSDCEFNVVRRHNGIDESTLRNSLKHGSWNDIFDKKNIKKIEKMLDIKFNI